MFSMADKPLNLTWTNPSGKKSSLNSRLVAKQNLTQQEVNDIIEVHCHKDLLFSQMESATDPAVLKELAEKVTEIEFKLQKLWGFTQDANFHYWWSVPQCDCPRMDNQDRYGTSHRIINPQCKVHGK